MQSTKEHKSWLALETSFGNEIQTYWGGDWGCDSEVGTLRAVLLRRPGKEIENIDEQIKLLKQIISMSLSVRELEGIVYQKRKPRQASVKKKNIQNPDIILVQEKLQRYLGTKVRISSGRKRGAIKIEFYSLNDLQRIINLISHR